VAEELGQGQWNSTDQEQVGGIGNRQQERGGIRHKCASEYKGPWSDARAGRNGNGDWRHQQRGRIVRQDRRHQHANEIQSDQQAALVALRPSRCGVPRQSKYARMVDDG